MKNYKTSITSVLVIILFLFSSHPVSSQKKPDTSRMIYVPVYSSIFHGNQNRVINLAVTLSIRNLDRVNNVTVYSIDYYNQSGVLIRNYLNSVKVLKPLETMNIIIKEKDTQGGSTACFIISWDSGKSDNELFTEAVMIGTYPQGISFTSRGVHVKK